MTTSRALAGIECLHRVIAALGVDGGAKLADHLSDPLPRKNSDMINAAKRGQHLCSVELPVQWTSGPLEFSHRSVAVHGDKKSIPAFARLLEVTDVSGVEEVETAIGEHELLSRGRILFAEGFQSVMGDKLIHQNMGDVGARRGKKILLFSTPENSLGFMRCLPRPH
jgi:hypothetical protein